MECGQSRPQLAIHFHRKQIIHSNMKQVYSQNFRRLLTLPEDYQLLILDRGDVSTLFALNGEGKPIGALAHFKPCLTIGEREALMKEMKQEIATMHHPKTSMAVAEVKLTDKAMEGYPGDGTPSDPAAPAKTRYTVEEVNDMISGADKAGAKLAGLVKRFGPGITVTCHPTATLQKAVSLAQLLAAIHDINHSHVFKTTMVDAGESFRQTAEALKALAGDCYNSPSSAFAKNLRRILDWAEVIPETLLVDGWVEELRDSHRPHLYRKFERRGYVLLYSHAGKDWLLRGHRFDKNQPTTIEALNNVICNLEEGKAHRNNQRREEKQAAPAEKPSKVDVGSGEGLKPLPYRKTVMRSLFWNQDVKDKNMWTFPGLNVKVFLYENRSLAKFGECHNYKEKTFDQWMAYVIDRDTYTESPAPTNADTSETPITPDSLTADGWKVHTDRVYKRGAVNLVMNEDISFVACIHYKGHRHFNNTVKPWDTIEALNACIADLSTPINADTLKHDGWHNEGGSRWSKTGENSDHVNLLLNIVSQGAGKTALVHVTIDKVEHGPFPIPETIEALHVSLDSLAARLAPQTPAGGGDYKPRTHISILKESEWVSGGKVEGNFTWKKGELTIAVINGQPWKMLTCKGPGIKHDGLDFFYTPLRAHLLPEWLKVLEDQSATTPNKETPLTRDILIQEGWTHSDPSDHSKLHRHRADGVMVHIRYNATCNTVTNIDATGYYKTSGGWHTLEELEKDVAGLRLLPAPSLAPTTPEASLKKMDWVVTKELKTSRTWTHPAYPSVKIHYTKQDNSWMAVVGSGGVKANINWYPDKASFSMWLAETCKGLEVGDEVQVDPEKVIEANGWKGVGINRWHNPSHPTIELRCSPDPNDTPDNPNDSYWMHWFENPSNGVYAWRPEEMAFEDWLVQTATKMSKANAFPPNLNRFARLLKDEKDKIKAEAELKGMRRARNLFKSHGKHWERINDLIEEIEERDPENDD